MAANEDGARPAVSVVIPTHRREIRLAFVLEALEAQTLAWDRFEVIVVRSDATPPPHATAPEGLDVRFIAAPPSRAGQRNAGWQEARAPLVAFTDDDCRPAPEWLESLLARANGRTSFVQGRTEPDPDERHLLHGLARSVTVTEPSPWYPTCNIAFPRALLEQLDGFDETFVASGEDTDLALRARELGAEEEFADEAVVWHAVEPQPLPDAMASGWRRWHSTPLVFKRHPAHRSNLVARVFFNGDHAALALLVAGALAWRRRPGLAVLAAVPFAVQGLDRDNLGPRGLVRQALHFPARLLAEGARAAGIARGAVRHRTLVL
jgi:GT2 family glycosyltransferase